MEELKVCPKCGNVVRFSPYFGVYLCTKCNFEMPVETANKNESTKVEKFKVITLCGSTRFKKEFMGASLRLTFDGFIVLMPHVFAKVNGIETITPETHLKFDQMHKQRIDMSDAILVINKDGYIGENTREEIEYAKLQNKPVYYMYMQCDADCVMSYKLKCKAYMKLPAFRKSFDNKCPMCPYYVSEDK